MKSSSKPIIGWREWVSLPGLRVTWIKAKVDTGARTSSLHAFDVEVFRRRGAQVVRFEIHPYQRSSRDSLAAEMDLVEQRWVASSSGHRTLRPVIVTDAVLLGLQRPIELTLINRDAMGFRMLLGREAIRRAFLVDPGRSFVAGHGPAEGRRKTTKGRRRKRTGSTR